METFSPLKIRQTIHVSELLRNAITCTAGRQTLPLMNNLVSIFSTEPIVDCFYDRRISASLILNESDDQERASQSRRNPSRIVPSRRTMWTTVLHTSVQRVATAEILDFRC